MAQSPKPDNLDASSYAALLAEADAIKGVSLGLDAWRRLKRDPRAMMSLIFLVVLTLAAFLTPLLPLQSPIDQRLKTHQYSEPTFEAVPLNLASFRIAISQAKGSKDREKAQQAYDTQVQNLWYHPVWIDRAMIRARVAVSGDYCLPSLCGTDRLGRDIFSRLFWGARVSLTVGVVATLVSLSIGVSYGATAGFLGGWVDNLMMRIVDVLYSIPFIFVVIFALTILNEPETKAWLESFGINKIVAFYLLIGAIYWLTMSRVVRGQVISLRNEQFVDAARVVGASQLRIIFRHLVPNVLSIVIVYLSLTIPAVMLFEAFLSFLGLGVEPPNVSWGLLANEGIQAITPVKIYWWLVVFPGLALGMTLFALNFLGDGLRDALDPRMKNR